MDCFPRVYTGFLASQIAPHLRTDSPGSGGYAISLLSAAHFESFGQAVDYSNMCDMRLLQCQGEDDTPAVVATARSSAKDKDRSNDSAFKISGLVGRGDGHRLE